MFCCHAWAARWGDFVAANCIGSHKDRFVWMDVFAVRQWPGNAMDLDFVGVVERCKGFIFAQTTLGEGVALEEEETGRIVQLQGQAGTPDGPSKPCIFGEREKMDEEYQKKVTVTSRVW